MDIPTSPRTSEHLQAGHKPLLYEDFLKYHCILQVQYKHEFGINPIQKLPIIVNLDYYYKDTKRKSILNAAQTSPAVVKYRVGQEHESQIERDCQDILCTLRRDLRGVQLLEEDAQKKDASRTKEVDKTWTTHRRRSCTSKYIRF